jgi:hypothetical protein
MKMEKPIKEEKGKKRKCLNLDLTISSSNMKRRMVVINSSTMNKRRMYL